VRGFIFDVNTGRCERGWPIQKQRSDFGGAYQDQIRSLLEFDRVRRLARGVGGCSQDLIGGAKWRFIQ
jgi:hypothetical protein